MAYPNGNVPIGDIELSVFRRCRVGTHDVDRRWDAVSEDGRGIALL
jgi:hypothetical protein